MEIKDLDNPNPAGVSIRLSMRKQETTKSIPAGMLHVPPPPPQLKVTEKAMMQQTQIGGKWTVVQEGLKHNKSDDQEDDGIIQEWNTVQPVISESEKKLLEQLKGKLKNKTTINEQPPARSSSNSNSAAIVVARTEVEKENRRDRRDSRDRFDRRDRNSDRRPARRSISRSPTRSRSRGRDYRRHVRRSRSPSRGRGGGWRGRRRNDRSRSRSLRRRSRSYDRRRRTRSRTRSTSRGRVEKPIVRQPEFRPRVPEKDKEKEKKITENKKEKQKAKTTTTTTAANSKAKLPFIGKMPVFKKQTSGQQGENGEKRTDDQQSASGAGGYVYPMDTSAYTAVTRPPAPTAAQIQMAMMEDAYGNAPPFHPDAGMMVDYDDLMPDPVQFVNIMGQAPPPPPPQSGDEKDMLPPGIDEEESEEFLSKPVEVPPPPPPGNAELPQDLEDALNIIFPGEKKPEDDEDEDKSKVPKGRNNNSKNIII